MRSPCLAPPQPKAMYGFPRVDQVPPQNSVVVPVIEAVMREVLGAVGHVADQ